MINTLGKRQTNRNYQSLNITAAKLFFRVMLPVYLPYTRVEVVCLCTVSFQTARKKSHLYFLLTERPSLE
jgi:hypothetical protein